MSHRLGERFLHPSSYGPNPPKPPSPEEQAWLASKPPQILPTSTERPPLPKHRGNHPYT